MTMYSRGSICLVAIMAIFWFVPVHSFEQDQKIEISMASLTYSYNDPEGESQIKGPTFRGVYGFESTSEPEQGQVVHVLNEDGGNHACDTIINAPAEGQWIALIKRGGCKFHEKIHTASKLHNAAAVLVYDHEESEGLLSMSHNVLDVVSVFINKSDGERLANLVDHGLIVNCNISVARQYTSWLNETVPAGTFSPRNNTMLVTLLTFVGLLILSLACLLIYAIRRSQYVHKMNRPGMVFTLQDGVHAHQNLLTNGQARSNIVRNANRPRPGQAVAWQQRWMPARPLDTIPEDQQSLEQSIQSLEALS